MEKMETPTHQEKWRASRSADSYGNLQIINYRVAHFSTFNFSTDDFLLLFFRPISKRKSLQSKIEC